MAPALLNTIHPPVQQPFLLVSNIEACYPVPVCDIMYCTGYNSSTLFQLTNNRKLVASNSIGYYEELLSPFQFIRSHQSYLINIMHLQSILKGDISGVLLVDGTRLPLSRSRKAQVLHQLKQCSIENAPAVHQLNSTRTTPENHHTLSSTRKTGAV